MECLYRPEYAKQAFGLTLLGHTDKDLAKFFDISLSTVETWKRKYPEFYAEIHRGKDAADGEVANAFYLNCVGYYKEEDEAKVVNGKVKIVKVMKWHAGDKWAQQKWLSTRQRKTWSEVHQVSVQQTNINISKIDLTGASTEELRLVHAIQQRQIVQDVGDN